MNSKTDASALTIPKEGHNQYINRQSMNARLILVEKKMDQIGKKLTLSQLFSDDCVILRILVVLFRLTRPLKTFNFQIFILRIFATCL